MTGPKKGSTDSLNDGSESGGNESIPTEINENLHTELASFLN